MRRVKYQVWLSPGQSPTGKRVLTDERMGFFHQWGSEIEYNGEQMCQQTIGIIEDMSTKGISTVYPYLIAFIDEEMPPVPKSTLTEDSSVSQESPSKIRELEMRARSVEKSVKDGYFALKEALLIYRISEIDFLKYKKSTWI